jgi:hypothetical protein
LAAGPGAELFPAGPTPADPGIEVVFDEGERPPPGDLMSGIAPHLIRDLARVRTALDAELAVSMFLGMFDLTAPPDASTTDRTAVICRIGLLLVEAAERDGSADALAALRALGAIGPAETRRAAASAAARLAAAGVPDRSWVRDLGRPELLRAWRFLSTGGEREWVTVVFGYGRQEHTLAVLVDHTRSSGIRDCRLSDDPGDESPSEDTTAVEVALPALTGADARTALGTRAAATALAAALAAPECPRRDGQIENVALYRELLRARVELLAALVGPEAPTGAAPEPGTPPTTEPGTPPTTEPAVPEPGHRPSPSPHRSPDPQR